LRIFDPQINLSRLIGSNEQQIQARMPHLAQLLQPSAEEVLATSEVVVISQKCASLDALRGCIRPGQIIIDVNGWRDLQDLPCQYEGICWG
jgi:GDP-mannose 6-dehydrogenase